MISGVMMTISLVLKRSNASFLATIDPSLSVARSAFPGCPIAALIMVCIEMAIVLIK